MWSRIALGETPGARGRILRYAVVGVLGTAIHFGVLAALVEWGAVDAVLASAVGFLVTLLVSYVLNHRWTFKSPVSHGTAFGRYAAVSLLGLGLNSIIMYLAVHVFGLWYILAQALVVIVVPAVNYSLNRSWTFGPIPPA